MNIFNCKIDDTLIQLSNDYMQNFTAGNKFNQLENSLPQIENPV